MPRPLVRGCNDRLAARAWRLRRAPPATRHTPPRDPGTERPLAQDSRAEPANSICLMTFAGAPAAMLRGGMSFVTTELAPITQRSPMVTPLVTTTLAPNQQLSPMRVGPFVLKPCHVTGFVGSS